MPKPVGVPTGIDGLAKPFAHHSGAAWSGNHYDLKSGIRAGQTNQQDNFDREWNKREKHAGKAYMAGPRVDLISGMMLTNPGAEGRLVTARSGSGTARSARGGPTARSGTARSGTARSSARGSARSSARSSARRNEAAEVQIEAFRSKKEELEAQLRAIDHQLAQRAYHEKEMGRTRAGRPFAMFPMSARTTWGAPSARDPPADYIARS